jgi:hypothetical protein
MNLASEYAGNHVMHSANSRRLVNGVPTITFGTILVWNKLQSTKPPLEQNKVLSFRVIRKESPVLHSIFEQLLRKLKIGLWQ